MPRPDAINSLIISILIGVFIIPIVLTVGLGNSLPRILIFLLPILTLITATSAMWVFYKIVSRIPILWQFGKFALVGVLNTAIDFGVLNILIILTGVTSGTSIIPIKAFAFSSAVLNSYFWNKRWVFAGQGHGNFVIFFIVTAVGIAVNSFVVFIITTYIPMIIVSDRVLWANMANVVATGVSMVWNFMGYRLVVFRK